MFDTGEIPVEGKTVLELGAGAGLPGLICALVREAQLCLHSLCLDKTINVIPINMIVLLR